MDVNIGLSAVATGTADVITATFSPAITLSDARIVFLRTSTPNTTTTPTFNPNALGAQVVKGKGGATLKIGEILGDCILMYHVTGTYWELLNSTPFLDATSSIQTQITLRQKKTMPFYVSAPIAHTGTTNETVLASSINLVGVIEAHDYFLFESFVTATNNANLKTVRWYISDSPTAKLNEVLVGAHSAGTGWGSSGAVCLSRFIKMKSTLSGNIYVDNSAVLLNQNNIYAQSGAPLETGGTIDFSTGSKYLIQTGQLANAVDTLNILEANSTISTART